MKTTELQKLIDFEACLAMPRYAGGHDDQMQGLFKGAKVLAHWNEGDYQGSVATAVQLEDGRYCWYQDSYGSRRAAYTPSARRLHGVLER